MKILVISYFYPPFNSVGAIRVGATCDLLARQGHEVRVVTADNLPLEAGIDVPDGISTTKTRWINVNRLPELALGGRARVKSTGFSTNVSLIGKLGKLYQSMFNFPDGQVGWIPFAVRAGERIAKEWEPDIIYASAPPYSCLIAAQVISVRSGIPWIAELRDLWMANYARSYGFVRTRIESVLERRVLESASGCVVVSDHMAQVITDMYPDLITRVVMNGYDDSSESSLAHQDGTRSDLDKVKMCYTGSVYMDNHDVDVLIEGIELLRRQGHNVSLSIAGRSAGVIEKKAIQAGVGSFITNLGVVSRKQAREAQAQADLLIFFLWQGDGKEGVVSGKIFEYIKSGVPILAIGESGDAASVIIHQTGTGRCASTAGELAEAISSFKADGFRWRELSRDEVEISHYSRENQVQRLDKFIRELV